MRSWKQTLAKHAGLNVAFGFVQRLFVCRACWWRLPVPLSRQIAKPCTTQCHPSPSTPSVPRSTVRGFPLGQRFLKSLHSVYYDWLLRTSAAATHSTFVNHATQYPALWDQQWFQQSAMAHAVPAAMFDQDNLQIERRVTTAMLWCHVFPMAQTEHVRPLIQTHVENAPLPDDRLHSTQQRHASALHYPPLASHGILALSARAP
jgi:hypothetical protein